MFPDDGIYLLFGTVFEIISGEVLSIHIKLVKRFSAICVVS